MSDSLPFKTYSFDPKTDKTLKGAAIIVSGLGG